MTAQNNIVLLKFLWDFVIPSSPDIFADPDMSQVGDVSIDNWNYEWKWGILDSRGRDGVREGALQPVDWIELTNDD